MYQMIAAVFSIVAIVAGGVIWAEERYAKEEQVAQTVQEVRVQMLEDRLRDLEAREQLRELSDIEELRKKQIKRQLERIIEE